MWTPWWPRRGHRCLRPVHPTSHLRGLVHYPNITDLLTRGISCMSHNTDSTASSAGISKAPAHLLLLVHRHAAQVPHGAPLVLVVGGRRRQAAAPGAHCRCRPLGRWAASPAGAQGSHLGICSADNTTRHGAVLGVPCQRGKQRTAPPTSKCTKHATGAGSRSGYRCDTALTVCLV